jgi:hypothetical protein
VEKRNDIDQGVATLPAVLRTEAAGRLARLKPIVPGTSGLRAHDPSTSLDAAHFTLGIDPATGSITRLQSKGANRDWASPQHPLALFSYQTLSKSDYDRFLDSYITVHTVWAPTDFGKPNIEKFGALSRTWRTKLLNCWSGEDQHAHRIVSRLQVDNAGAPPPAVTAWPDEIYLDLVLPKSEPVVHINFSWFRKRANRLPEAMWLTFNPDAPEAQNWVLSKVGQPVSPADVVSGGNRHMHALSSGLSYQDARGKLTIETLDAPLVALGEKSPIYFSNAQPDLSKGVHFSLFNNGWGTNYIQWFGEDMRFRFTIKG